MSSQPIPLHHLGSFDPATVLHTESLRGSALSQIKPLVLQQWWRQVPDPLLKMGRVWLATTSNSFAILAELEDHDIGTTGSRHNDPLWDCGDVFEIFLRHKLRCDYFEFQVAPNGFTVDLHYPRLYAPRAQGVAEYLLPGQNFRSCVKCDSGRNRWRVTAEIPVTRLVPTDLVESTSEWQFSFSRYDSGPGRSPIVSSTSPHPTPDFHRAEDWLHFVAPPFSHQNRVTGDGQA